MKAAGFVATLLLAFVAVGALMLLALLAVQASTILLEMFIRMMEELT